MKVRIAKMFDFDAAHWLPNVPDGHKCRRMHGHTYKVEIICEGEPDERGFVLDYAEIEAAWKPLHEKLDRQILNGVEGLENPTTENLAPWVFIRLGLASSPFKHNAMVVCVRVYESATTWCEYPV